MSGIQKKQRVRAPLMLAFRNAYVAKDARQRLDLRDESGERVIAGRRTFNRGAATETAVRDEVRRDLENLLNTVNLESIEDLEDCDDVRKSILNFGVPDVASRSIDEVGVSDIVGELEEALINFEPRLIRQTIHVERDKEADIARLLVRFVVRADMFSDPLKVPVEFFADVQMDSGKVVISRL